MIDLADQLMSLCNDKMATLNFKISVTLNHFKRLKIENHPRLSAQTLPVNILLQFYALKESLLQGLLIFQFNLHHSVTIQIS